MSWLHYVVAMELSGFKRLSTLGAEVPPRADGGFAYLIAETALLRGLEGLESLLNPL